MKNAENEKYGRLAIGILVLWLAMSIAASALLIFKADSKYSINPPLPLGLAVVVPILGFVLWFAASPGFRQFALSLNVRVLTLAQSWRIGGFVFLILYAHGILPGVFALPAGWGDMAIGITAPVAAIYFSRPGRKTSFIAWQLLGMTDLALAVTLGVLASPTPIGILAHGITTDAMTTLPLSLIPTFAVPLLTIFHIIAIAQATSWNPQLGKRVAEEKLHASVV